MSARTRFLAGPVRGRTHRSAPTRGSIREPTEICAGNGPCPNGAGQSPPPTGGPGVDRRRGAPGERRGVVTPPYGCNTGDAKHTGRCGHRPLRKGEGYINHPGQRRTAERLRRGWEGWVGIAAEITPKGAINAGQSLSQPAADSSLYTREPLGTGDADCRVASLLAMTVLILCHSEEAQRADVGIRPFSDGRGFGPPYLGHGLRRPNFVPKFGASVKSSAPTESPINHPSQPARSEASAPAWARDGRESVQRPSQKGDRRRDRPGSA